MEATILGLILWGVAIYVAGQIGKKKNRTGYVWGILLGWIGVLAVAILPELPPPTTPSN